MVKIQAVILAAGFGARLGKFTKDKPKPMVKVGKYSVIENQIKLLKKQGIENVVVVVGYKKEKLKKHIRVNCFISGNVAFTEQKELNGSAGALLAAKNKIKNEDFIVLSGDVILDLNLRKMFVYHKKKFADATFVVHPNDHPYDSDLVKLDKNGKIIKLYKKPHNLKIYDNMAIASAYVFNKKIFNYLKGNNSVEETAFNSGISIFGYRTVNYIKDMGTIERLESVRKYHKKWMAHKKCKPAVFLDRDGVINKLDNFLVKNSSEFELIPGVVEAIKVINNSRYACIVITNQATVARGLTTEKELNNIHMKMQTLLGNEGAYVDAIYYCPHHPDADLKEYRCDCICRKPNTGMIEKAVKEFDLDLKKSVFVGDSTWDFMTAKNAGIKCYGVKTGKGSKDSKFKAKPKMVFKDLLQFTNYYFGGAKK